MARAPLQVLVFPFRRGPDGELQYAVFRRSDADQETWQGVSGGAEDDETAEAAAHRELAEETGLVAPLIALDAQASIPAAIWRGRHGWGEDVQVIPERSFGAHAGDQEITLSSEHTEQRWLTFEAAHALLRWDSNRAALRELNERLNRPRP